MDEMRENQKSMNEIWEDSGDSKGCGISKITCICTCFSCIVFGFLSLGVYLNVS